MKDCKKIKNFKSFFHIDHSKLRMGKPTFADNILEILDENDNVLPMLAKLESFFKLTKFKKNIMTELEIQSFAGVHGLAPKIYDAFECTYKGKSYITMLMEKIEGPTLDEIVKQTGLTPYLKQKLKYSIDKLYDIGISHQDMHGGNFIIENRKSKGGNVRIIDFGAVKLHKGKVPVTERVYTIRISGIGYIAVGKEHPDTVRIKKQKLANMKIVVNNAKKIAIKNQIKNLRKQALKYKKANKPKMVDVFCANIAQQQAMLAALK